jgi:hypothetical protein
LTEIHSGDLNGGANEGGKSVSKKLRFQFLRLASLGIDKNLERRVLWGSVLASTRASKLPTGRTIQAMSRIEKELAPRRRTPARYRKA